MAELSSVERVDAPARVTAKERFTARSDRRRARKSGLFCLLCGTQCAWL